jgi:WD40 repeat protein
LGYTGRDQTLRIWSSKTRLEIARLSHNSQVICLAWLDGDAAVLSLGEDGVLGKWTRIVGLSFVILRLFS